jgi:hypothetical protein
MTVVPLPRTARAVPVATVQGTLALDLEAVLDPPSRLHVADPDGQPPVEQWARRFAQAAVEIVGGDRPPSQLLRWTTAEVYADLHRRAMLVARAGGHVPGAGRVIPVRPQVRSVHTSFVAPTVAETSIHVRYGERSRAVAARFEQRKGRWLCTALDFS